MRPQLSLVVAVVFLAGCADPGAPRVELLPEEATAGATRGPTPLERDAADAPHRDFVGRPNLTANDRCGWVWGFPEGHVHDGWTLYTDNESLTRKAYDVFADPNATARFTYAEAWTDGCPSYSGDPAFNRIMGIRDPPRGGWILLAVHDLNETRRTVGGRA